MKKLTLALALLASAALVLPLAAQAQQSTTGASATKPVAKKKHTAEKTERKKPVRNKAKTKKGVPLKTAKAVEAETPVQTPTERLTDAELETAQQIYTGTFPCEQDTQVTVTADANYPGFFTVTSGKLRYYMHPVESRTGAIRMEDNRRGAVWLQLGPKSMLMDQQAGQRVADNCEAQAQKDYVAHMQDQPQNQLLAGSASGQQPQQAPGNAASAPAAPASNQNPPGAPETAGSGDTQNQAPASSEQAPAAAPVGSDASAATPAP